MSQKNSKMEQPFEMKQTAWYKIITLYYLIKLPQMETFDNKNNM